MIKRIQSMLLEINILRKRDEVKSLRTQYQIINDTKKKLNQKIKETKR